MNLRHFDNTPELVRLWDPMFLALHPPQERIARTALKLPEVHTLALASSAAMIM